MAVAILSKSTAHTVTTSAPFVSFDTADESGETFWSAGNPTRLTVPAGVTELEIFVFACAATLTGSTVSDANCFLYKNGSVVARVNTDDMTHRPFCFAFPGMTVAPGDYFEVTFNTFSTSYNYAAGQVFLMACTPERVGFAAAKLNADTGLGGSYSALVWATPEYDFNGAWNGSSGFEAPSNANYAVVSYSSVASTFDTSPSYDVVLKVNGTTVRRFVDDQDWWLPGFCFGIVAVSPGDIVTIEALGSHIGDLVAAYTRIGIEWLP